MPSFMATTVTGMIKTIHYLVFMSGFSGVCLYHRPCQYEGYEIYMKYK